MLGLKHLINSKMNLQFSFSVSLILSHPIFSPYSTQDNTKDYCDICYKIIHAGELNISAFVKTKPVTGEESYLHLQRREPSSMDGLSPKMCIPRDFV